MIDFSALLIEGLFYEGDGGLAVEQDGGRHTVVEAALAPLLHKRVQLALHHKPRGELDASLPGAGSCLYPGGRCCPADHDRQPGRLLTFHETGVLRDKPYLLLEQPGRMLPIPFGAMPGHYGRLAVVSVIDVDKLREDLKRVGPDAVNMTELTGLLQNLRETLKKL